VNLFQAIEEGANWNPGDFKACTICESIVMRDSPICPACLGYRFLEECDLVHEKVLLAHQRHKEGRCLVPDFRGMDRFGVPS
jgi:hypothetical protein